MLPEETINAYLSPLTPNQQASICSVRSLIKELSPDLIEEIDEGKWFGGKLCYYTADRMQIFALGPLSGDATTFHMMAFYGSPELQEKHTAALKRLLTGKSCIKFEQFAEVPEEALRDIISSTPTYADLAREFMAKRAAKAKKPKAAPATTT